MNVRKSLSLPSEIVAALERHRVELGRRIGADVTLSATIVNLVRTYLHVGKPAPAGDGEGKPPASGKKGARSA